MKTYKNNIEIKFEISEDSIDFFVNNQYAGDFQIENNEGYAIITPNSIDLEQIGYDRQGVYNHVIDTILQGDLNDHIDADTIDFNSVLRTEAATRFWQKRGYKVEYDEQEHLNGEQEVIEIKIK